MAWITPVTDRTNTARLTAEDLNRIGGNINYLLHAISPATETVLALDDNETSPTLGHLLLQQPSTSDLLLLLQNGNLNIGAKDPNKEVSAVELVETTSERNTYEVTFTNSETELFYTQGSLGTVAAVVKDDWTTNDFVDAYNFSQIVYWTQAAALKYGVMIYTAPDMAQTWENYNNIENLLLQCKNVFDTWQAQDIAQKHLNQGIYLSGQYSNYLRGI